MQTLCGSQVELRDLDVGDTHAVHRLFGDDEVTRWLSFDSRSLEQCRDLLRGIEERARVEPRSEYYLGVVAGGELAGFVRLGLNGARAAKIGYAVNARQWGQGLATDAVRTVLAHAFESLGLHRVTAAVGPTNDASLAVLKKVGMRYEGRLRDHVFTNGEWRDSLLYSILEPEWGESVSGEASGR